MGAGNAINQVGKAYTMITMIPLICVSIVVIFIGFTLFFQPNDFKNTKARVVSLVGEPCPTNVRKEKVLVGQQEIINANGDKMSTSEYTFEDRTYHACERIVEYKVDGKTFNISLHTNTPTPQMEIGQNITVWYEKINPSNAKFSKGFPTQNVGLGMFLGGLFVMIICILKLTVSSKVKYAGAGMMATSIMR